jgi:hypothetical protein
MLYGSMHDSTSNRSNSIQLANMNVIGDTIRVITYTLRGLQSMIEAFVDVIT